MGIGLVFSKSSNPGRLVPGEDEDSDEDDEDLSSSAISTKSSMYSTTLVLQHSLTPDCSSSGLENCSMSCAMMSSSSNGAVGGVT